MVSLGHLVRFGAFEADLRSGELYRSGRKVRVPRQSFHVLAILLQRPGELVTRDELKQGLWAEDTFVDFDQGLNNSVQRLRDALHDSAEKPRFIETLPRRGYRFIATLESVDQTIGPEAVAEAGLPVPIMPVSPAAEPSSVPGLVGRGTYRWWIVGAVAAVLLIVAGVSLLRPRRVHSFTPKDSIVLGEFRNGTTDPVFDEMLRQGLAVELEQSPFLNVVSETRVQQILRMMSRPANTRLEPAVSQEICERNGSVAVLDGTINALGSAYVLGLRAVNCRTGELLAEEQAQAQRKEDVLNALDVMARDLRTRLGESMSSLERYDRPLADVTTSSLEALKTYSLGVKTFYSGDLYGAIPYFQRATQLDPEFAAAWGYMACACSVEPDLAIANITRAYALRGKTTERERLFIEATYNEVGTGDLGKADAEYELWAHLYPRDLEPQKSLAYDHLQLGDPEKALTWARAAIGLGEDPLVYLILARGYTDLNRLAEADATYSEMDRKKLAFFIVPRVRYQLAFLAGDAAQMDHWVAMAKGVPHAEDAALAAEADTAAWHGKVKQGRELAKEASESAKRNGAPSTAAVHLAYQALFEAEVGNEEQARTGIEAAMRASANQKVLQVAPLVMARIGDVGKAEMWEAELVEKYPNATISQRYFLPAIRAEIALRRNDPQRAIGELRSVEPMEFASANLLPTYVRAESYLRLGRGDLARLEFQKYLDHWGLVGNSPEGALARLGLARAYALTGDVSDARQWYAEFLRLWKDADEETPILREARRESARLG